MNSIPRVRASLFAGGLMLIAGACWALQVSSKLFVEGKLASSDVRVINGTKYVPLNDVAAALHYRIEPQTGGVNMTLAGGAGPVKGEFGGVVGDPKEIFTGQWRFWPRTVQQGDSYTAQYSTDHEKITPRNAGETLVVIDCRIKNATQVKQEMIFTVHSDGVTSLTDDQEHAYAPIAFDARNENGPYGGPTLLPGSAGEFAVIFSVPQGTVPKNFIFSILASPANTDKGTTLRISIPKQ